LNDAVELDDQLIAKSSPRLDFTYTPDSTLFLDKRSSKVLQSFLSLNPQTFMPGQESPVMPEMDQSKLPGKTFSVSKAPGLLTNCLAAVPLKHSFAAQNVNVPPEAPVKKQAICKSDCLQPEKQDAVDWDFWLTPKFSVERARHLLDEQFATRSSQTNKRLSQNLCPGTSQPIPGLSHYFQQAENARLSGHGSYTPAYGGFEDGLSAGCTSRRVADCTQKLETL
jgi:hypothetical protein